MSFFFNADMCILKTTKLPNIFVCPLSTSLHLKKEQTETTSDVKVEYSPELVKALLEKMEGDLVIIFLFGACFIIFSLT